MKKPLLVLAALTLGLALLGIPAHAATTSATVAGIPSTLDSGDRIRLSITTKKSVKGQKAHLEHWHASGGWQRLTSTNLPSSGTWKPRITPPLGENRYRVKLVKKGNASASTSNTVKTTVRPVISAASVDPGQSFDIGGTLPRSGKRPVELQSNSGGTWSTIDGKQSTTNGAVAFSVTPEQTASYRLRAPKAGSRAVFTSPARTVTVTSDVDPAPVGEPLRVVTTVTGAQTTQTSDQPTVSDDGRYVAYRSFQANLVPNDTNGEADVFLWDRIAGTTTLVSRNHARTASANSESSQPEISGNGRYVFFTSRATDLVASADPYNLEDVFRWDRLDGSISHVSDKPGGGFTSDNGSFGAQPSSSGDVAYFRSGSAELRGSDGPPGHAQLYRWQAGGGSTLVSLNADDEIANAAVTRAVVSGDGRVAFSSNATNLADPEDYPVAGTGVQKLYTRMPLSGEIIAMLDRDGGAVTETAFVRSISDNGRVAFESSSPDLVPEGTSGPAAGQAYVWGSGTGDIDLVSRNNNQTGDGGSSDLAISGAGFSGVYLTFAKNLASGPYDDLFNELLLWNGPGTTATRILKGLDEDGNRTAEVLGWTYTPELTPDGDWVVFTNAANNLIAGDGAANTEVVLLRLD